MDNNKLVRFQKPIQQTQNFDAGKLPPQALDMEEAVLGALMLESDSVNEVIIFLHKNSFYKETHCFIYQAILELFEKKNPIDILTVTEQLRKKAQLDIVGGPYYISQLTNKVASATHLESHARIIQQKFIQRELIRVASEIIKDAYDETTDVFDLIKESSDKFFEITCKIDEGAESSLVQIIEKVTTQVLNAGKKKLSGINTGFHGLNELLGGWQKSDLVIIAGRPGMGKTAFSLCSALLIAETEDVAFFSLEMSEEQLMKRLISVYSEMELYKLNHGLTISETEEFLKITKKIEKLKLNIFDKIYSLNGIYVKCKKLKKQSILNVVFIDYLGLVDSTSKSNNREREVAEMTKFLKRMAKELDVPVILLSQLSRAVETRGGSKRPQLSDLRESGAIEQDADVVCFLYRPEYYGITHDSHGIPTDNKAYCLVEKHRNGSLDDIDLTWIGNLTKFIDAKFPESENDFSGDANKFIESGKDDMPF